MERTFVCIGREWALPTVLFPNTFSPERGSTVKPLTQKVQICKICISSGQSLAVSAEQGQDGTGDVAVSCGEMAQPAIVPGADTALDGAPVAGPASEKLVVSGEWHHLASQA